MSLYLLTTTDYSAVIGYAECEERSALDFSGTYVPRVVGYDTDQRQIFTRKGLINAERRAHNLGMRLVVATYFGISTMRPEDMSSAAYAHKQATERGWTLTIDNPTVHLPVGSDGLLTEPIIERDPEAEPPLMLFPGHPVPGDPHMWRRATVREFAARSATHLDAEEAS